MIVPIASAGLAQPAPGATDSLLQYGAIGVLAALAVYAAWVLFGRMSKAYDLERARADRLEAEVRELNKAIQEKYLGVLAEATRAISDALAVSRRDR